MLLSLSIKNYLLIDSIDLKFNSGLSIITGETGAGKSIILDAISLLLGKRADSFVMPDKESKSIVEASFDISKLNLKAFFDNLELDFDNLSIIRREILPNGKSRAFVNESQVNLSVLKTVTEKFIDLHSQHENLALSNIDYRLKIIDSVSGISDKYILYSQLYQSLSETKQLLKDACLELEKTRRDIDYYKFQADQIELAKLDDNGELELLESQSSLLENAEEIKENILYSINILDGNDTSIDYLLKEVKLSFGKILRTYKPAEEIISRLESLIIETRDIANALAKDVDKAESNPELLQKINSRIDLINTLLLKHSARNIEELKLKHSEYNKYIQNTEDIENKILNLKKLEETQYNDAFELAKELSRIRSDSFQKIEDHISSILKELGIQYGVFKINNEISTNISSVGIDNINFLFSANKSVEPQILEKVASGGEFSRLMLALKSLIAGASGVSTIIFDEIDTGVSGEIASKMGKIMKKLSEQFQVIAITHLPQVAALGNNHYKVYKDVYDNKSVTKIKELSKEDRVIEIASMISGETLTPQAVENAKILLENNF